MGRAASPLAPDDAGPAAGRFFDVASLLLAAPGSAFVLSVSFALRLKKLNRVVGIAASVPSRLIFKF